MNNKIWLIGAGLMAREYAKVLKSLGKEFTVIGRSESSAVVFEEATGIPVVTGGLDRFLEGKPSLPEAVILSVGIETLAESTKKLLAFGVKQILVEKPGIAYPHEIDSVAEAAEKNKASVWLAYNRRFYSSVRKAREIIAEDGGVASFTFEFTEWSHSIRQLVGKTEAELHNWFLGNSTHVVDTAFFLGGKPKELVSFVKGGTDWHPKSAVFSGAGISENDALFSYQANWEAPGRWVLELLTKKHRLIFKPMETLQIQKIGSVAVEPVVVDDSLDKEFKPGLYLQTKAFLEGERQDFCDIQEQKNNLDIYCRISGYTR